MREQDIPIHEIYAEALAEAATESGRFDDVFQEALELKKVLEAHRELLLFLEKPAIETEEKKQLLRNVFTGQLSPLMLNLALLLVDKFRGGMWLGILDQFIVLAERKRGIFAAKVSTAHTLDETERGRLQKSLEGFTGKQLRIQFEEDPDLLGGVLFRYGDLMIDNSIRGALKEMRMRMNETKIH